MCTSQSFLLHVIWNIKQINIATHSTKSSGFQLVLGWLLFRKRNFYNFRLINIVSIGEQKLMTNQSKGVVSTGNIWLQHHPLVNHGTHLVFPQHQLVSNFLDFSYMNSHKKVLDRDMDY